MELREVGHGWQSIPPWPRADWAAPTVWKCTHGAESTHRRLHFQQLSRDLHWQQPNLCVPPTPWVTGGFWRQLGYLFLWLAHPRLCFSVLRALPWDPDLELEMEMRTWQGTISLKYSTLIWQKKHLLLTVSSSLSPLWEKTGFSLLGLNYLYFCILIISNWTSEWKRVWCFFIGSGRGGEFRRSLDWGVCGILRVMGNTQC